MATTTTTTATIKRIRVALELPPLVELVSAALGATL